MKNNKDILSKDFQGLTSEDKSIIIDIYSNFYNQKEGLNNLRINHKNVYTHQSISLNYYSFTSIYKSTLLLNELINDNQDIQK